MKCCGWIHWCLSWLFFLSGTHSWSQFEGWRGWLFTNSWKKTYESYLLSLWAWSYPLWAWSYGLSPRTYKWSRQVQNVGNHWRNAEYCQFNPDIHCPDGFVCWKKEHTEQHHHMFRRPEYSLASIIAHEKLLDYQINFLCCNTVYMQWLGLKKTPGRET